MDKLYYDVFLSYNSQDCEAIKRIASYLKDEAGLEPWLDVWHLIPGEPWVRNLKVGLSASKSCAVFVGENGEGPWNRMEVDDALQRQAKGRGYRVIPVLLPDAPSDVELPPFLSRFGWVKFEGDLNNEEALHRLECGIRGVAPGETKRREPSDAQREDRERLTIPGSVITKDSRACVPRVVADEVLSAVVQPRGIAVLRGPT